ncbi:aminotransferase class I/II-fold pyridoxal phosphate-dependent enzyme [Geodermatophilus sp. DF01-2]|uniref:MalY/PatB family protein n=1 Tax=Geodermatophilus sp. DF01-2 TaxID=2559610 RepID=UPI001073FF99|nr:aminotransferase class I/II-fold pyridoxal phosphate-dependent enzyme [Geodermatophilus sp. DF01_2]TFV56656.1 aminotransferase class I/II-fold pyridoxal phosphate-dependent enzyme [Geodermatophilus sp. DF01_2]
MADRGFDEIGIERLRALGGLKWSLYPEAIGAFVAEMDFGTAPAVTEALHAAVDRGAFGYLPPALVERMSEACAEWVRTRCGWAVPPERVRPLADVLAGLAAAIEHFSRPGSPVILPTPAYMPFLTLPPTLGREVLEVPMARDGDRYVYDLDALDAAFRAGGHLLVLCNPHNPIGRVLRPAEMTAVAEVVERHGGRVFSDEIHAPLVHAGHRHVPYASLDEVTAGHTVTAMSASKAWNLPGLKCAQLLLSNDHDADLWSRVGAHAEHGAATLGVVANTAAYTGGAGWLDDVLAYLDGNRRLLADLVAEHLPGVAYIPPEGTYLAWLDCRSLGLPDPGAFFLEHAGVALVDGALCGAAGTGAVRLNFATPRPVLAQAVEQMGAALAAR